MTLTRRAFLAGSGAAAGGLVVGCALGGRSGLGSGAALPEEFGDYAFDAWLQVARDGRVVLQLPKVEMGQGTMTGLATLVAEELEIEPWRIDVRKAPVHPSFRNPLQVTGGSTSTAESFVPLRQTAARARELLRRAAGARLGVSPDALRVEDGHVVEPASGRRLSYGELAEDAARLPDPGELALKPPSEMRWIGRSFPRLDAEPKVRGEAEFGIDVKAPGLRSAVVVRPPGFAGRVSGFDATAALAVPGVEQVFEVPSGIAVVASSYWRARKAAALLEPRFDPGESKGVSSESVRQEQRRRLAAGRGKRVRDEGDVDTALDRAGRVIEVEYYAPYLAHATMEPMNCTIVPRDGGHGCDVYIGTQAPDAVQDVVAARMGCSRDEVSVHTTYMGGGFGRRGFPDVAIEAAEVASRAGGAIKLVWSREDDMAHDYYRPSTTHRLRAALEADGRVEAWDHALVAPSIIRNVARGAAGVLTPEWMRGAANFLGDRLVPLGLRFVGPVLAREGAVELPYAIPHLRVATELYDPGIPVGFWRSVGHSHNGFAVEGFVDELAHEVGQDPVAFRRSLLGEHPELLGVLDLAAERAEWDAPLPAGRARGVALHESFGTPVAEIAEVSIEGGKIRVHRVTCAVDCGVAVNPDIVRAQMESGIIYGLTAALHGEIHFEDGAAVESNFHDYPMLRMDQSPAIDVHIVPSDAPPTGVGEPSTPPIAPAVANAVFALTGQRLRELPLRLV